MARVQQPRSCRKGRRHIKDRLTRADELLGQQRPGACSAFDSPESWFELRRPAQQSLALSTISAHQELTDQLFVAVNRDGGMRPLMRVDSNDEHEVLLDQK